jgi:hypothetical protein
VNGRVRDLVLHATGATDRSRKDQHSGKNLGGHFRSDASRLSTADARLPLTQRSAV